MIKNICIYCNNDIKSNNLKKELIKKLEKNKYKIVNDNEDLGIAIGGDGAFLRMIKQTNFNSDIFYIGVNTGTLGFAQEVNASDIDDFIEKLNTNSYKTEYIISTSFGSTAYNLSFGGAVICNSLHTTQITPIAPLNSKSYRNLLNSIVIPQDSIICVNPEENKDNLIITVDGENKFYDNVKSITMYVKDKRIKMLRGQEYNFIDKVNEKFLK